LIPESELVEFRGNGRRCQFLDNNNARRYYNDVIKTFGNKETERLFLREISRTFPPEIIRKARLKLEILDGAEKLDDLKVPPGNRLEKLSGDREGQHSIRINQQWRICFRWKDGDCYNVEIVDYH